MPAMPGSDTVRKVVCLATTTKKERKIKKSHLGEQATSSSTIGARLAGQSPASQTLTYKCRGHTVANQTTFKLSDVIEM